MVLPSGRTSHVSRIVTFDGDIEAAYPPLSVTVCLEDEIDISRGDMLTKPTRMPHVSRRFEATVVWMQTEVLAAGNPYLLKHGTHQVGANVTAVLYKVDVNTLAQVPADRLELNEIGVVALETHRPIYFDSYRKNRQTGAFVLIDPVTNATVAAGMISERKQTEDRSRKVLEGIEFEKSRLTAVERWERAGHRPVTIWLTARIDVAYLLERELFDRGCQVHVLADEFDTQLMPELAKMSSAAGLITICSVAYSELEERERARELVGTDGFLSVDPELLSAKDKDAVEQIAGQLEQHGFIRPDGRGTSGVGI
ncbi:MAG: hypothetical protein WKF37_04870 [Bryobacteraceae bacterium]